MTVSDAATHLVIFIIGIGAVVWAIINSYIISLTPVQSAQGFSQIAKGEAGSGGDRATQTALLIEIYEAIRAGAQAFLVAEYKICVIFCIFFFAVIVGLVSWGENSTQGGLTGIAFALGAITSILSGYIGMTVAVYSNVRTTINAQKEGFSHCFNTAFRAGSVMGFALNGLGLLVLYLTLCLYRYEYEPDNWDHLMECISGYGLGGSTIAMFGRVGGGIYTKAADVGADLVGKVVHGIPEDDPRNPATIADNVGDNVGDVAGRAPPPTPNSYPMNSGACDVLLCRHGC
jgi:H+-translocating diphosphatase